jgi:hypothetical protein
MLRLYVAAPFGEQAFARCVADRLDNEHQIVSSWLHVQAETDPTDRASRAAHLEKNTSDLMSADAMVALVPDGSWPRETYIEIGRALASGMPVFWWQPAARPLSDADSLVTAIECGKDDVAERLLEAMADLDRKLSA